MLYLAITNYIWWNLQKMNENEEVWRWVHLKYGMSRIMQKLLSIGEKNALSLLLPTMFDWINKAKNESDEVWRLVKQKHGMSWIIQK